MRRGWHPGAVDKCKFAGAASGAPTTKIPGLLGFVGAPLAAPAPQNPFVNSPILDAPLPFAIAGLRGVGDAAP